MSEIKIPKCKNCKGTGRIPNPNHIPGDKIPYTNPKWQGKNINCPECKGSGYEYVEKRVRCPKCKGQGTVVKEEA